MGYICFFNTAKAWGGGEKWHLETSLFLHENGHKVIVVAHKNGALFEKLKKAEIPVIGVKLSNLSFLNPITHFNLLRALKKYEIETIVMNLSRDVKIAGICAKQLGFKRIIYRRGSAIPIKNSVLNRYYFGHVITEVLANSYATKQTVLAKNKDLFPEDKIKVIYNGIDISNLPPLAKKSREFTLLNLGRLEAQKNQFFLIELAKELKKRNYPIKIVIGGDGRLKEALQQKITELQVDDIVKLAGFIEHPLEFITTADVFVLPSLWEGFGYVLAEAALCKKPIIAFDISSNPELVIQGQSGFLVKTGNIIEFANAVEKLYHDPELIKTMGEQGFTHIKKNFDKTENLKKIETYLTHG